MVLICAMSSSDIVLYGCDLIYCTMLDGIPGNLRDTSESESQVSKGRIPKSGQAMRKIWRDVIEYLR